MTVGGSILEKDILRQLELTRQLMIASGLENGLLNKKTIQLSEKVDQLINEFDAKRFEQLMGKQSTQKMMQ